MATDEPLGFPTFNTVPAAPTIIEPPPPPVPSYIPFPTFATIQQSSSSITLASVPPSTDFPSSSSTSSTSSSSAAAATISPISRLSSNQPINPSTPANPDDVDFLFSFMRIHRSSLQSNRYAYFLWWIFIAIFVVFLAAHLSGSRSGYIGAWFSKFALRRRTWRKKAKRDPKKHRQPFSFPSNAQLVSISFLTLCVILALFVGPDYIAPHAAFFEYYPNRPHPNVTQDATPSPFAPHYTINKAWWTVGNRAGLITFALIPLVILFALKAPPFALLALPFTLNLHFDKLVRLHRWTGLLAWIVCTLHAVTWVIQIAGEKRAEGGHALFNYVFKYQRFRYATAGYVCMTLLMIASLPVVRRNYYEQFFFAHIILVPLFIIFSALHFPGIAWWCWLALAFWLADRLYRLGRFLWINGYVFRSMARLPDYKASNDWNDDAPAGGRDGAAGKKIGRKERDRMSYMAFLEAGSPDIYRIRAPQNIPTGFAKAELLPGRTIRLQIMTHRRFHWSPGQHVLLRIPSVSMWTTHPFTVASVCQTDNVVAGQEASDAVTLIIRAKAGFTRRLWNEASRLLLMYPGAPFNPEISGPSPPVLMRAQIDGPMGSVGRVRWDEFSTVVIICGGSGISYGIAILQHLCFSLAATRSGNITKGKPVAIDRIRFVWMIREFAHLQWAALEIYECLKIVTNSMSSASVRVDIYVSNSAKKPAGATPTTGGTADSSRTPRSGDATMGYSGDTKGHRDGSGDSSTTMGYGDTKGSRDSMMGSPEGTLRPLSPPLLNPYSRSQSPSHSPPRASFMSDRPISEIGTSEDGFLSRPNLRLQPASEDEHDYDPRDLTNFDGDDDTQSPGEANLSYQIRKEGQLRRRATRGRPHSIAGLGSAPPPPPLPMLPEYSSRQGSPQPTLDDSNPDSQTHLRPHHSHSKSESGDTQYEDEERLLGGHFRNESKAVLEDAMSYPPPQPSGILAKVLGDEAQAMSALSMFAVSGRAPMNDIIHHEVGRAKGRLAVTTCGPSSLDVLVRKTVAARINPSLVASGDPRGNITLIAEEFDY